MSSLFGVNRDPRSYGQDPDVTWGGLLASFGLAFVFQSTAILSFSLLRRTFYGKQWLTPKRAVCPTKTPPDLHYDTLFGWIPQLMNVSESQILMYSGYDVVMFLKCLRLGFWTLAYFSPYALFVILPLNCVGHGNARGYFVTTVSNISLNNVSDKARPTILSVHLVGVCLFQFILMGLTLNLHLEYIQLRRAFMKQRAHDATVFVSDIPLRLQSSSLLKQYFEMIYGEGKVKKVQFMKHIEDLDKVIESRENTVLKLERSILMDQSNKDLSSESTIESDRTKKLREKLLEENTRVGELHDLYQEKEQEHESRLLNQTGGKLLSKSMSSKFDLSQKNGNPLMTWLDVDDEDVEGGGDVELMAAADVFVLEVRGPSLEEPLRIELENNKATILSLKRAIFSETGVSVEVQELSNEGLQMSNEKETVYGYGLKSGDVIDMEEISNPSILAHGEASHSSRRQRLSMSGQYEENLKTKSSDIWRRGTTLVMAMSNPTHVPNGVTNGQSPSSPRSPQAHFQKPKGERLPLTGSLVDLLKEVRSAESVREGGTEPGSNSNKALVTFNSIAAATIASQAVHSVPEHRQLLTVEEAPHSDDVFWANIHKGSAKVRGLRALTSILTFSLVVFFVLPVTYLNQLFGPAKMESLATKQNWHWLLKSLTSTLLPMTLVIISNLLPPLFTGLGFFEGCLTWSLNGLRQFDRMMWFLLVNVYGVSIISGTIIESIVDILRNPTTSASIIADVLPTMSGFFIQYLIVKACVALMIELLRGLTVFHMATRYLFQCKDATKRERLLVIIGIRRYNNPGWLPYGKHFPHILLVLTICLSFAPIAPLILVPGLVYFANAQLVYRYTLSYVYEPRFEIGGGFWPKALKWIIRTMYMSQGFMICIFLLREFFFGVVICFGMLYVTSKFGDYMSQKERNLLRLPLEVAVYLDKHKDSGTLSKAIFLAHLHLSDDDESEASKKLQSKYIQPSLIAERDIQPEELNIGKSGLWSTDPLHGGVCVRSFLQIYKWMGLCKSDKSEEVAKEVLI